MKIVSDELLITEALYERTARPRDLARELDAINDLARRMVRQSDALQHRFVELALDLCRAGSAGISLLEKEGGETRFRWTALAGEFAPISAARHRVTSALAGSASIGTPLFWFHARRACLTISARRRPQLWKG